MPFNRNAYSRKRRRSQTPGLKMKKTRYNKPAKTSLYRRFGNKMLTIKGSDFMPQEIKTKFNYIEKVTFTAVTTPQTYVFRGNGPFDPNQTGTGNQPIGYDQFNTFYTYCEVTSSKIQVDFINYGAAPMEVVIMPIAASNETIDYVTAKYMPNAKTALIDKTSTGSGNITLSNYCTTNRMIGIAPQTGSDVRAVFTAVPGQQWYWGINMASSDAATPITVILNIQITYYCILSGRKRVALS